MHTKQINRSAAWHCCLKSLILLLATIAGSFWFADVFAGGGSSGHIGDVANRITDSFEDIGSLMIAISYIAGIGFAVAAIFKFKQHKDNPTQIPLGTPIAMLVIGIALVFLPAFFEPAGKTIFGEEGIQKAGGFKGDAAGNLPGNK